MPCALVLCVALLGGPASSVGAPRAPSGAVRAPSAAVALARTVPALLAASDPARAAPAIPQAGRRPPDAGEDAWIGEDKARHFLMSFGITMLGYGAARAGGVGAADARFAAAVGSGVAGIGKEIHDARAGGPFSVRDLAWDAAGITLGVVVLTNIR